MVPNSMFSLRCRLVVVLVLALGPAGLLVGDAYDDGMAALARGDHVLARKLFLDARASLPRGSGKAGEALYRLSRLEPKLEERIRLLEDYLVTHAHGPHYGQAGLELVQLHLAADRLVEAARIARSLTGDRQCREQALVVLARTELALKRPAQALAGIDACLREYPASGQMAALLYARGDALRMLGQAEQASRAYHRLLELHPDASQAASAWLVLGEMATERGDARLAMDYLNKLTAAFPRSFEASLARGRLQVLKGEQTRTRQLRVYEVQLAVFFRRDQAERFATNLSARGYLSFVHQEEVAGRTQYTIRMGFFRTNAEAETVRRELAGNGFPGFIRTRMVAVTEDDLG